MAGNKFIGRTKKETEQEMIESRSVYTDDVYSKLHDNILKGKYWAIRLWF
jgi:hypothetical protein